MILDRLVNADIYRGLPHRLVQAMDYLRNTDIHHLAIGKHTIDGEHIFALVQEYTTRTNEQIIWEAHRKYHDVQLVLRGTERMGIAPIETMRVKTAYDPAKEAAFFDGTGDYVTVRENMFAVFMPHDVHAPNLCVGSPAIVRKIVVKVAV